MIFHVEFYNRATGALEHNDSYPSIEQAFADAHGRLVIVAETEGVEKAALFFDHIKKAKEAGKDWWAVTLERLLIREMERDRTIAELLEALKECLPLFDMVTALDDHCSNALGQAESLIRGAIAKAEGRADGADRSAGGDP